MKAYLVNAFTYRGGGGYGAGVVPCSEFPPIECMQKIAQDIGFSETVFIRPEEGGYRSSFFTPRCEVPLCGHATIAAFYVMGKLGNIKSRGEEVTVKQQTGAGRLSVRIDFENRMPGKVFMEQSDPAVLGRVGKEGLAELCGCLGLEETALGIKDRGDALPEIISTGLADIIVPVLTRKALDYMKPDFERLAELSRRLEVIGAHVFTMETETPGFTVRCRNFGPAVGIDEEAATGTSNGALGYYLYRRGLLEDGEMVSEQGFTMGRPSAIFARVGPEGVWVGGEAEIIGETEVECK
jgi:PhzF family phenazine biosynthesis protein